ncbi:MAG TPA: hypothetical protein VFB32_12880 [Rudaea sp.]|nr:hypothetical protein [Rudaea sp.]
MRQSGNNGRGRIEAGATRNARWQVGRDVAAALDPPLLAEAADPDAVIWYLMVDPSGHAALGYDDEVVAILPARQGIELLKNEGNPAECAADVLDALTSGLAVAIDRDARIELELALARWIPEHF